MATITTLATGDTGSTSRTTINDNFTNLNTDKIETSVLDTDTTLAADSDSKVATQKATKAYVDAFAVPDISCRVYQSSAGATGSSSMTTQSFQVEDFDTDEMHEGVTNPSRITIKTAGKYMVGGTIKITSNRDIDVQILLNGTTIIAGGGFPYLNISPHASTSTFYNFAVNDYIELQGASNGAGVTSGDALTNFWAYKVN